MFGLQFLVDFKICSTQINAITAYYCNSVERDKVPRTMSLRSVFRSHLSLSIYLILFVTLVHVQSLDCNDIQDYYNCGCAKSKSSLSFKWFLNCSIDKTSEEVTRFNVELKGISSEAKVILIIDCSEIPDYSNEKMADQSHLNSVETFSTVTKLEIHTCPLVNDAWEKLFDLLSLNGEIIKSFDYRYPNLPSHKIPMNFFNNMPNLEFLTLNMPTLSQFPNLSNLKKLKTTDFKFTTILDDFDIGDRYHFTTKTGNYISHDLTKIEPGDFPSDLQNLNLKNCKFSKLSSSIFSSLKKLKKLNLYATSYIEMDRNAFDGLISLENFQFKNSWMPHFPNFQNLRKLVNLTIMKTDIFQDMNEFDGILILKNLPLLTNLCLPSNKFQALPSLTNLPELTKINLNQNKLIEIKNKDFGKELPSLKILHLKTNNIKTFEDVQVPSLEELDISENKLIELHSRMFLSMTSLKKLNLAQNQIRSIDYRAFESLQNLEELDLSHNQLSFSSSDGTHSGSQLQWLMQLERLNLRNNDIESLDFMKNLKVTNPIISLIDLSYNKIRIVAANELGFSSKKVTVNLENNNITKVDMGLEYLFQETNENHEVKVQLNYNPLMCDCKAYEVKALSSRYHLHLQTQNLVCHEPSELRNRTLSSVPNTSFTCDITEQNGCPKPCTCKQRIADQTVLINCSKKNLTKHDIPSMDSLVKTHQDWTIDLDLSDNKISGFRIPGNICKFLYKIKNINLTKNNLPSLAFMKDLGSNSTKFAIAGNRFLCNDCEGFQTIRIDQQAQISDLNMVQCDRRLEGQSMPDLVYIKESNILEFCHFTDSSLIALLCMSVIALIFLTCLSIGLLILSKFRWTIKAYLYSKGIEFCWYDTPESEDDANKMYDAFISYSHKDEEWVLDELVKRLEKTEGFKLCVHFRDWTPGDWIPDQIVRSVDKSKRTIIVLSKNFVESVWSRLEFKAAHAQALKERSNRVILILLGDDLKESDVQDEDLKIYMRMNTFMKWNDPLFWHRLMYALPHRRSSCPILDTQNLINTLKQRQLADKLDKLRVTYEGSC